MLKGALCPNCGEPLEMRNFTDVWDSDKKPSEINEDPYCPACKLRWIPMETEPDEEAEG